MEERVFPVLWRKDTGKPRRKEGDSKKGGKKEKMGKWSRRVAGGGGGARKDDRPEREMAK